MFRLRYIVVLLAIAGGYFYSHQSSDARVLEPNGDYSYDGYEIEAVESFTLEGRVLSRKNYRSGRESALSPTDLAMGWGEMQEHKNLAAIDISQRNRWVYWKAKTMPIPRARLNSQMANIHIIPASHDVEQALNDIDADDLVRIRGQLVNVTAADGWRWRSSLTRTDTGDGSCELLWLEKVIKL